MRDGINVVIWSFMEIHKRDDSETIEIKPNSLDFDCIQTMIESLDKEGYDDTVHLVSFGGWNGPHLDPHLTSERWYATWKEHVGHVFHGIDWDLEGHDDLTSATNVFTVECLEKIGRISQLAKADGYTIGMAPPQSYLDIHSSKFSRRVDLTEPNRPWHAEFHYFGANVYAYLLSKYGDSIDFVSVQFYESYSRAGLSIHHERVAPDDYLVSYITDLLNMGESFDVKFGDDPTLGYKSQRVSFPLSKLVLAFANGWALDTDDKALFFEPRSIQRAYERFVKKPRGMMFWVLGEEGSHGVQYTRDLNRILKIRNKVSTRRERNPDGEL